VLSLRSILPSILALISRADDRACDDDDQ